MEVKWHVLRQCLLILINRAERCGFDTIHIDEDSYWTILREERFNFGADTVSPQIGIGSLHDDYASLKQLLERDEVCSSINIDRLAYLLLAISHSIDSSGKPFC